MSEYQGQIAVVYARYSSHSQTEQSIEGQLADAHAFAEKNGIIIISEYIDRAMTGKKDNRPEFQRMIKDSAKHQFSLVLVWKLDRFARNIYDSAVYERILNNNKVSLVSVTERFSDDPMGVMVKGVMNALAEFYSADLAEKVRRGQRESRKKGWFPGGPIPFGYVHQDHKLVPDDRAVPIVHEIFDRYNAGEAVRSIVRDLNNRGIRFKEGHQFSFNGVSKMLDNQVYIGNYVHGGEPVEGCAVPIIDKEVFEAAAALRAKHRRAPAAKRTPKRRFLLLGKLFCGECGLLMSGDGGTSRTGKQHYYYTCSGKKRKSTGCNKRSVPKEEIEYAISKIISEFVLDKSRKTIEVMAGYIMEAYLDDYDHSEIDELEAQLIQINRDLEKLVDSLMRMPESAQPRIAKRMEDLENQRKEVEAKLSKKRLEDAYRYTKDDVTKFFTSIILDVEKEINREFIINKFLNAAYLYEDGRVVIYLNQFKGIPNAYETKEPPGKDAHEDAKPIFNGPLPKEIKAIPDFIAPPGSGSALYSYAPLKCDKAEPRTPHLFFLHGMVGIVVWRQSQH